jgi:hypothetical protein
MCGGPTFPHGVVFMVLLVVLLRLLPAATTAWGAMSMRLAMTGCRRIVGRDVQTHAHFVYATAG